MPAKTSSIAVVGGGIAGVTAAVEAAELGREVFLIEKTPTLGGRVAGMKAYFPKLCPPVCGLEINYRRIRENPHIHLLCPAEVLVISGESGDFTLTVESRPTYFKETAVDPVTPFSALEPAVKSDFDYGLGLRPPAGMYCPQAYPLRPVVREAALSEQTARARLASLPGVDLQAKPETLELRVGAIVWATGWEPYDASRIDYLHYGEFKDVVTNVEMERLAATDGPTEGRILRPSDGREPKRVAFVQCAGSRDERHLPYCSGVCCLASLKQASYVREAIPDSEVWIFYIDIRAGKYEAFFEKVRSDGKVHLVRGKPGLIERDAGSGELTVLAEDMTSQKIMRVGVDLVVLATGLVPATRSRPIPYPNLRYDEFGFFIPDGKTAIFPAGCAHRPADVAACVQDATAAALLAATV